MLSALLLLWASAAGAVLIDEFSTNQGPVTDPPGAGSSVATGGADILDQRRDLTVDLLTGIGPATATVGGNVLTFAVTATTPDSRAEAVVTWDGDSDPNVLSPTGLNHEDLTASGHASFRVLVNAADAGTELVFEVFTNGASSSRAARRLPLVAVPTAFYFSYANDFTPRLGTGADFTDVGAITLTVRGTETAALQIERVETAAPSVTVTKEKLTTGDAPLTGAQLPGTTFKYRVTITNTGGEAVAVDLDDTIDANTSLAPNTVDVTPVAVDDAYETFGNVDQSVPAPGLLANDRDPDTVGAPPELTVDTSTSPIATALGGTATLNADGSFTYAPPTGRGRTVDQFTYTVLDNEGNSAQASVRIHLGRTIWFVDDAHPGLNLGTRNHPFVGFTAANVAGPGGSGDQDGPGDIIFVFAGTHNVSLPLEADQALIGEGEGLILDGRTIVAAGTAPTLQSSANGIALAQNNTIRGLTVGNTVGVDLTGNNFGTLTVGNVTLNGQGGALDLTNGALAATFNSIASTNSPARGVHLDTVTGTLTVTGGTTITDSATAGIRVANGGSTYNFGATTLTSTGSGVELVTNATSTFTFASLAVSTDSGPGLLATSSGTVNIGGSGNTISATGGPGVNVTGTSFGAGATFSNVSSSGSPTNGINLDGVSGSFTANGGSITTATGIAIDINAGTGAITYAGTVNNGANRSVEITGRTASTVTLSGNITDSGTGVRVASNTGGTINLSGNFSGTAASAVYTVQSNSGGATINFSGATKTLSTGVNTAVTVASNGGANINFTGGGLSVTTTSGTGFTATGGGNISVQGSNNLLTSTTGTALNVASTTIAAAGLTFRSISSNGAPSGIILNNTGGSGGLTVTGTGGAGSGGTIQNSTGTGVSLATTSSVSLSSMNIQGSGDDGINGANVTGFALTGSNVTNNGNSTADEGIEFDNLLGVATITSSTVSNSAHNNVYIDNTSGTLTSLTITGSAFNNATGASAANGFLFEARSTATVSAVTISGSSSFASNFGNGIIINVSDTANLANFTVQNSTFDDNNTAFILTQSQSASATFNVLNNTIVNDSRTASSGPNATSHAIVAGSSSSSTGGTLSGKIQGNQIGNSAIVGSGSSIGNGIRIILQSQTAGVLLIDGNMIRQTPLGRGIEVMAQSAPGLDATITNNDVNPQDTSGFPLASIFVTSDNIGPGGLLRTDIRGNTVPLASNTWDYPSFNGTGSHLRLEELSGATTQLVDTPPASASCTAQLTSTNTGSASANAGCALIAGPINTPL